MKFSCTLPNWISRNPLNYIISEGFYLYENFNPVKYYSENLVGEDGEESSSSHQTGDCGYDRSTKWLRTLIVKISWSLSKIGDPFQDLLRYGTGHSSNIGYSMRCTHQAKWVPCVRRNKHNATFMIAIDSTREEISMASSGFQFSLTFLLTT